MFFIYALLKIVLGKLFQFNFARRIIKRVFLVNNENLSENGSNKIAGENIATERGLDEKEGDPSV